MKVGKPFSIKGIGNTGETFIPVRTTCRKCKKSFRIIAPEILTVEGILGSRLLDCMACENAWTDVMQLMIEEEAPKTALPVQRVSLSVAL